MARQIRRYHEELVAQNSCVRFPNASAQTDAVKKEQRRISRIAVRGDAARKRDVVQRTEIPRMLTLTFAVITALQSLVAQAPAALSAPAVLNNGACLDSIKAVPQGLFGSDPTSAIVKIDKVVSTSSFINGEIIGYLYTRQDGTTWLGQRKQDYMSSADSQAVNAVFSSTHLPGATITEFPPVRKFGVKTNYTEVFQVNLPQGALDPLHVRLEPCVAWPSGMALPNPLP